MKESSTPQQKSIMSAQENTLSTPVEPLQSRSEEGDTITFNTVMLHLQVEILNEVIAKVADKVRYYLSQIEEPNANGEQRSLLTSTNSDEIIGYINWLLDFKEAVARLLSWMSVIANITHHLVVNFDEQLSDEVMSEVQTYLSHVEHIFDSVLTGIPSWSILGITLTPDQRQVSETKAIVSEVFSRIEEIKQENEEANQDWGPVEQKAYERIQEGSTKNISGEEFLSWLSDLEQDRDV